MPFTVPRGYSGNAFAPPPIPGTQPPQEQAIAQKTQEAANETEEREATEERAQEPAAPAFSPHREGRGGGIFERLPFLSSLLPPPRKRHGEKEGLPEWVVIGIVLLLLFDSPENDLLPFLLILLLWD